MISAIPTQKKSTSQESKMSNRIQQNRMEDNEEAVPYRFIDRKARIFMPFQAKSWKESELQRAEAEKKS